MLIFFVLVVQARGRLDLHNAKTSELLTYELIGRGEEPIAEDMLKLECQARQTLQQPFKVRNYSKFDATFTVESDLPNTSGAASIQGTVWLACLLISLSPGLTCTTLLPGAVRAGAEAEYVLSMCPQLSGQYTGSVTFTTPDHRYLWYGVELSALAPKPEQTLTVACHVRSAASVRIGMANPLNEPLEFDVVLNADGAGGSASQIGLLGEHKLRLGPRESGAYEFVFAPLRVGNSDGSISFVNEKAGEFWYALKLQADPAPPVVLKPMMCAVGQTAVCVAAGMLRLSPSVFAHNNNCIWVSFLLFAV